MAISGTYAAGDEVIMRDCLIEVDLTPISSSTFAEIVTWSNEIAVDGGDVPTSQVFLFQADGPAIFDGNRNAWRITTTILYTTGSTDPFHNIWLKHENPDTNYASDLRAMNIRWAPQDTTGDQFTTSGGKLVSCTPPQGNADATTPALITFVIEAQALNKTTL